MTKRMYCSDVEADSLLYDATKIWCASFTELTPRMKEIESFTHTEKEDITPLFTNPDNILVMHNGIGYDGPVLEKIYGIKVKAEIVDTLYLSWYLYPKMLRHGLDIWGEELGVSKVAIDDWENLSLDQYKERCRVDVQIQVLLWKQIWGHLMLLYGSAEGCWHVIRHLNFKAKCLALQEESKWKLEVEETRKLMDKYIGKQEEAKEALEKHMPQVPEYATRKPPAKPFKMNGDLAASGKKWEALVLEHIEPEDYDYDDPLGYKEPIKVIKGYKAPNAGSHAQIKKWLYSMNWEPMSFKHKRDKATNKVKMIPQIKDPETEELCESIVQLMQYVPELKYLQHMSIYAHRRTVVKGFLDNVDDKGFVEARNQGLTNTLRLKHKVCTNIPSARKLEGANIRGLLIARNEDRELCGSDLCSLEDRTKQHYMYPHDPDYVADMQGEDFDPHLDMAIAAGLVTEEDAAWYKEQDPAALTGADLERYQVIYKHRHGGKGTNYAATYGAKGPTIARSAGVEPEIGDRLYEAYWERNWALQAIADECITKNSRGMKWLWNPVAKIWYFLKADKDRFSTLNQGTGAYAFDRWLFYILEQRRQLTAQFHDEGIWELRKGNQEAMTKILKTAIGEVNKELKLRRDLDCDVDFGRSYAEIH